MNKWDFKCLGRESRDGPYDVVVGTMTPIPGKFQISPLIPPGEIEFEGLKFTPTHATISHCEHLEVYKNNVLFGVADMECCRFLTALPDGSWEGMFWLNEPDLVPAPKSTKVCTCGGWAVYGKDADIHSDSVANRCELREP